LLKNIERSNERRADEVWEGRTSKKSKSGGA